MKYSELQWPDIAEKMTSIGAMGRPDLADADKGRKLFEGISQRVIDFVREFAHWPRLRRD